MTSCGISTGFLNNTTKVLLKIVAPIQETHWLRTRVWSFVLGFIAYFIAAGFNRLPDSQAVWYVFAAVAFNYGLITVKWLQKNRLDGGFIDGSNNFASFFLRLIIWPAWMEYNIIVLPFAILWLLIFFIFALICGTISLSAHILLIAITLIRKPTDLEEQTTPTPRIAE